jgi:hypothetical protein
MFGRTASICAFCALTFGCAVHPLQEDVTGVTTVDIVHKVRCEAKAAILRSARHRAFEGAAIAYNFTFSITENNDGTAGADFSLPIPAGTLKVVFGAGDKKQRKGERTFKLADSFRELRALRCEDVILKESRRYPITGAIGLDEVVGNFVHVARLAEPKGKLSDFTDTITFTTKINGSINPTIALIPAKGHARNAGILLSADREDIHKVSVGLKLPLTDAERRAAELDKIVQVWIVGEGPLPRGPEGAQGDVESGSARRARPGGRDQAARLAINRP